jgi:hypothetical protein
VRESAILMPDPGELLLDLPDDGDRTHEVGRRVGKGQDEEDVLVPDVLVEESLDPPDPGHPHSTSRQVSLSCSVVSGVSNYRAS